MVSEDFIEETPSTAAPTGPTSKKKGGNKARKRRTDNRRFESNQGVMQSITTQVKDRLGLQESTQLATLKPASSLRPGGVHISLAGYCELVTAMLQRLRTVAARPLSNQLTDANILTYTKVAIYAASARIVSAQDTVPYVVGNQLEVANAINSDEFRLIDARCKTIPTFLAWLLSNIGSFEDEGQTIVPLVEHLQADAPNVRAFTNCYYNNICRYIAAYHEVEIPVGERATVANVRHFIPNCTTTAQHRFTNLASNTWVALVPQDWEVFTNVNSAASEQKLTVNNFNLTSATGSQAAKVRFPRLLNKNELNSYYCLTVPTPTMERTAICMRLGIDEYLPENQTRDRYIGNSATALSFGNDVPANFLTAQLTMLNKIEIG